MTYYLVKAHLGSLALEPEYHANAAIARAASREIRLIQTQTQIINTAKSNAVSALQLAISRTGFRDRLIYLPSFYHFLLVHSAGFLLLLLQQKNRFMLAGEAKGEYDVLFWCKKSQHTDQFSFIQIVIFELVEQFTQIFVYESTNLNYDSTSGTSGHSSMATAEALSRACQHLRHQIATI